MSEMHPGSNVTQSTFLQFIDELVNADLAVTEAIGNRKDVYKRAVAAGLHKAALIRARKLAEKAGDKREEEDHALRQYMTWLGKPIGFQADWIGEAAPNPNGEDTAIAEHQVYQVQTHGRSAGEAGRDRGANPWTAGTFLYQRWDGGWLAGQEALARKLAPEEERTPARRRGRPKGARNKPKADAGANSD